MSCLHIRIMHAHIHAHTRNTFTEVFLQKTLNVEISCLTHIQMHAHKIHTHNTFAEVNFEYADGMSCTHTRTDTHKHTRAQHIHRSCSIEDFEYGDIMSHTRTQTRAHTHNTVTLTENVLQNTLNADGLMLILVLHEKSRSGSTKSFILHGFATNFAAKHVFKWEVATAQRRYQCKSRGCAKTEIRLSSTFGSRTPNSMTCWTQEETRGSHPIQAGL